jgi:hypothetical protein
MQYRIDGYRDWSNTHISLTSRSIHREPVFRFCVMHGIAGVFDCTCCKQCKKPRQKPNFSIFHVNCSYQNLSWKETIVLVTNLDALEIQLLSAMSKILSGLSFFVCSWMKRVHENVHVSSFSARSDACGGDALHTRRSARVSCVCSANIETFQNKPSQTKRVK